jgi:hypothetical protein
MEYQFTAIATPAYLHVIGLGAHSTENIRRLLADTNRTLLERGLDRVLLEVRFIGPSLDFAGIYSIVVDNRADASLVKRIAYVDTNAEHLPERTEFAELAANKLGVNARVFRTVAEAERWLSA